MAKIPFGSLKIKYNDPGVKIFEFNEKEVEVKQHLTSEEAYDLIMITLQQSWEPESGIYNEFKLNIYFLLNIVFMFTNVSFTDKQKEDSFKLYDSLDTSGFINQVIKNIPEAEFTYLLDDLNLIKAEMMKNRCSAAAAIESVIELLPVNAAQAAKIVEDFDPEKYGEVINFAKGIGMQTK